MTKLLRLLTEDEAEEFYLIPIWICILIAGADNKIDRSEIRMAINIAREQSDKSNVFVREYYKKVAEKFEINLKGYLALLPGEHDKRTEFLTSRLKRVNYFFSKIEKEVGHQLYLSYREMAKKIAHASGGIFGLLSVSNAESKYIDLKMITDPNETQA